MNHWIFIFLVIVIIVAVLCGILIPKGPYASAANKYASASYSKEGNQYKIVVRFADDIVGVVSALHIHRGEGGTVGSIIQWFATTQKWHDEGTAVNGNSPCCNPQTTTCTRQAPNDYITNFNIADVQGKRIEYVVPYPTLGPTCNAVEHLDDKNVYLVVHGFVDLTPADPAVIIATKFV